MIWKLIQGRGVSFGKTLDRGFSCSKTRPQAGSIPADDAFKLHDTYGFPIDLTRIMAEERGMTVDIAGYEKLMEQAKELGSDGRERSIDSLARSLAGSVVATGRALGCEADG